MYDEPEIRKETSEQMNVEVIVKLSPYHIFTTILAIEKKSKQDNGGKSVEKTTTILHPKNFIR